MSWQTSWTKLRQISSLSTVYLSIYPYLSMPVWLCFSFLVSKIDGMKEFVSIYLVFLAFVLIVV